ncbi:MAG TPA: MFS transporter [Kofleriaceae bacterium]|jgi:MFS family permease|nr:MFS transporter [Kofleriaceae bacterium]
MIRRAAELARLAARDVRPAATIALGCAAASTGVVIPVLRPLVEDTGHGTLAAGVFSAAHVLGGAVGAALGARALRRAGSPRRLAAAALLASVVVTLAMAAVGSLELRIALRFLDGGCHLLAITALVAAATAGDPDQRARRAVILGVAIVLGVAGGLGIGTRFVRPAPALVAAAVLSAAALATVLARIAAEPAPARTRPARDRGPIAPGLLAFCERFSFGSMTVAMSFLASPARVGLVLGVFLVASVLSLGAAWRYAPALGPRRLAVRSAIGFTLALACAAAIDVLGSPAIAAIWAVVAGAAAGSLYASALVLATRSAEIEDRARGMATVHAAGSAGHALGALSAGTLAFALPGMLVIAVPGVAVIAAAAIGVWLTVPEATADCPVINALDPPAADRSDQPVT